MRIGAKRVPSCCEVVYPLESEPERLGPWLGVGANHVSAQGRNHLDHCAQAWRFTRLDPLNHLHDWLPLAWTKGNLTTYVGTFLAQTAQIQYPPCNDRINRHAVFKSRESLEVTLFDLTTRFECSKVNLNLPTGAVILDDGTYCFNGIDR